MIGPPYNAPLAFVFVVTLAVAVLAARNRPKRGATTLAGFMLTLSVWQGGHLAVHLAPEPLEGAFLRLQWLGIGAVAFAWLLFVLAYTDRDALVTRRTVALAAAWPAALNAAIWLSSAGVALPVAVWPALYVGEGPLFWAHVLLSYAVLGAGTALLGQFFRRKGAAFRLQGVAVMLGVLALWLGSLVGVLEPFGTLHLHAPVVGMTLSGLAFLWATTRGQVTDLVPVAASTVLRTMDAGVVVVDRDDRVVEVNPTAADMLGLDDRAAVVGDPLGDALAGRPELRDAIASLDGEATTLTLDDRSLKVRASPLRDGDGGGRVVLLGDITDQRRRQARLERQNERLDAFAAVVSHDLRNPLMVAQGFVDEAMKSGDVEDLEEVQRAHDRIDELVGDLLTLAREGDDVEQPDAVDLGAAARRAWDAVDTRGADLRVDGDRRLAADAGQLDRLLENLYRNSVEHGGDDVTVRVGACDGGFYVADDGEGIPEDVRDRVLESGFSTGGDGAGLGLAIVERVADAHGWAVAVEESEDGGARFAFTGVDSPG